MSDNPLKDIRTEEMTDVTIQIMPLLDGLQNGEIFAVCGYIMGSMVSDLPKEMRPDGLKVALGIAAAMAKITAKGDKP